MSTLQCKYHSAQDGVDHEIKQIFYGTLTFVLVHVGFESILLPAGSLSFSFSVSLCLGTDTVLILYRI